MPLGMEVGLGPVGFVFDGDPATPTQFFGSYLLWPNGWLEVNLGQGHIVLDGVPALPKGAQQPPCLRPMSIVATVAHLSSC